MQTSLVWKLRPLVAGLAAVLFSSAALSAETAASSTGDSVVAQGHALFIQKGCYECHGYVGQGSFMSGPSLAPGPLPTAAITAYVRAPKGEMPPYSKKILSDNEIFQIHAYLESIPPNPSPQSIPLLNSR